MRKTTLTVSIICGIALIATTACAVPKGRSITFHAGKGNVTFDGSLHNQHAKGCRQCHNPQVFPKMKQGTVHISMAEIYAGKQCGICHNGTAAFAAKGNCARCHK